MYDFLNDIIYPGSLVFDIGANVGAMTSTYLKMGASVVAVEPVPEHARKLKGSFPSAVVVQKAVVNTEGENITIHISGALSTVVPKLWWTGRFGHIKSNDTVVVSTTTLDKLIDTYGIPDYIKIDCEGYDLEVVLGLSVLVSALSFEYIQEQIDRAESAMDHLISIGFNRFNLMRGGMHPHLPDYDTKDALINSLDGHVGMWGDIVALSGDIK